MKISLKSLALALSLAFSSNTFALDDPIINDSTVNDSVIDDLTFGLGIGSFYSGLGVNVGVQSETDLKYMSLGCVRFSSLDSTCGMGLGWIQTGLFGLQSLKHGLSLYAGIIGSELNNNYDYSSVYGAGLGYHYFFNGINDSGSNLGFTLVVGSDNPSEQIGGMFQFGYQF